MLIKKLAIVKNIKFKRLKSVTREGGMITCFGCSYGDIRLCKHDAECSRIPGNSGRVWKERYYKYVALG